MLRVHGQDQRSPTEQLVQRTLVIHQQIAGAAPKEGLEATDRARVGAQYLIQLELHTPCRKL
jgi:hypothetical protein